MSFIDNRVAHRSALTSSRAFSQAVRVRGAYFVLGGWRTAGRAGSGRSQACGHLQRAGGGGAGDLCATLTARSGRVTGWEGGAGNMVTAAPRDDCCLGGGAGREAAAPVRVSVRAQCRPFGGPYGV